uniref:Uncharacterized protein n=1 Tax=Arundo donax TaxID=35708 RepID=A0A0A9E9Y1_ARUDO
MRSSARRSRSFTVASTSCLGWNSQPRRGGLASIRSIPSSSSLSSSPAGAGGVAEVIVLLMSNSGERGPHVPGDAPAPGFKNSEKSNPGAASKKSSMRSRSPTAASSITPQARNLSSSFCGACSMSGQPQPARSLHFKIFACQSEKAVQEQTPPQPAAAAQPRNPSHEPRSLD